MTQVNDVRDAHVETTPAPTVSPWQPLSQPVFRMLWIATVVSNVGSWMSDVGINWSMLTLRSAGYRAGAGGQQPADVPLRPAVRGDGGHR